MLLSILVLLFVLWILGIVLKIAFGLTFAILGLALKIIMPLLILLLIVAALVII